MTPTPASPEWNPRVPFKFFGFCWIALTLVLGIELFAAGVFPPHARRLVAVTILGLAGSVAFGFKLIRSQDSVPLCQLLVSTLVISFTVLMTLGVLEYASRRWRTGYSAFEQQWPMGLVRAPAPYIMFRGTPNAELGPKQRLNSLGYPGPAAPLVKAVSEKRIFLVGGSTVFAGNPPIAELLEKDFQRRHADSVHVFNYGVVSSVSGQDLARVVFEIADRSPDLVVMYNGGNDVFEPNYWDPRPGYPFNFLVMESNPLLQRDVSHYPALTLFLYGSNLLRTLFSSAFQDAFVDIKRLRQSVEFESPDWTAAIARDYLAYLSKASHVAKGYGAGFAAFFQPMLYYKKTASAEENIILQRESRAVPLALDVRRHVLAGALEGPYPQEVALKDLTEMFDATDQTVYEDAIHIRQPYQQVVADRLFTTLCPMMRARGVAVDCSPRQ